MFFGPNSADPCGGGKGYGHLMLAQENSHSGVSVQQLQFRGMAQGAALKEMATSKL